MGTRKAEHRYGLIVLTPRARQLRQRMTPYEAALWKALRDRREAGIKFRRQHPIGPYVVDFYCAALKLVIELDGAQHQARSGKAMDKERDSELKALGLTIWRFPNATPILEILHRITTYQPPSPIGKADGRGTAASPRLRAPAAG